MSSPTEEPLEAEAPHGDARLIAAVAATWTISMFGYYAQSQMLGQIMQEYGRGEAAVGWLFSLENAALALTTLAAAGPLARVSRTRAALAGAGIVLLANLASAFVGSWEALVFLRGVSGIGAGIAGAAGTAAAASARDPERAYAAVTVTWGLAGSVEPTLIPYATVPYGAAGGFLLIAGAAVVVMPFFIWLLPPRETPDEEPSLFSAPNRVLALVAMFGLLIFEVGQGGMWTFIAQIGEHSGLDEYEVGNVITGTGLAGLAGGVLATWMGGRFGRRWPIIIGLGLNVVAAVGLAFTHDSLTYIALNWLWNAAYYFIVPYLMGVMAAMDDLGRWVVASDGVWTLGDAVGPGLAGTLVEWGGGYVPLAGLTLVAGLACMLMVLAVLIRFEAQGGEPPGGGGGARRAPA